MDGVRREEVAVQVQVETVRLDDPETCDLN